MKKKTILVSYFQNVKGEKTKDVPIEDFYNIVKDEIFRADCEHIRSIEDKEKRDVEKVKRLPCITTSGTFKKGHNGSDLLAHSGLLQIDIDDIGTLSYKALKRKFDADKYTFACFRSPSGNGIKVIIKIPAHVETHLHSFLAVQKYFKDKYSTEIDTKCKDVGRVMFISSDKDIFVNENSEVFSELLKPEIVTKPKQKMQNTGITNDISADVENCIIQIETNRTDITTGYDTWLKIGFALVSEFGENGRSYFHRISQISAQYNTDECDKQFTKCLRGKNKGTTIKSFFQM